MNDLRARVRARICELVPEIMERYQGNDPVWIEAVMEITLSDILMALGVAGVHVEVSLSSDGLWIGRCLSDDEDGAFWNLATDFGGQYDELVAWIAPLVGVDLLQAAEVK